jgi:hypothetical protein
MASETFTVDDNEPHGSVGNPIQIDADTSFSDCHDTGWTFLQGVYSDEHVEGEREFANPHSFGFDSFETFEHSGETEKSACDSVCPSPSTPAAGSELHLDSTSNVVHPVTSDSQWQLGVIANHGQFSQHQTSLLLPWESGVFAEIFGKGSLLELPQSHLPEPDSEFMEKVIQASETLASTSHVPRDACFDKAVRNIRDLEYFENKNRQLELACGQWLELLSCNWFATGVGEMLATDMLKDASGKLASETLKASFGLKSPQTLLKRAATLRRYFKWHASTRSDAHQVVVSPLPMSEPDVGEFFHWLRECRQTTGRGFTTQSAFMETVRFSKFCLDMRETDCILQSRRLLGFSAIQRQLKGPTNQAPPLELIHLQRLHEVLESASCLNDRLGAGVMLVCVYGRARWSDLRFIHHVTIEEGRNGFLTLFTTEHKTSSVGAKREQYLPLVIPWMGVTHHEWVAIFLEVYKQAGLDINRVPLGPLMPAPRLGGGFSARPLSTPEAATWLRLLLHGTPSFDSFRAHSLKTTLLVWAAKAGLDKEVRAVLGHHASALEGSEVVYSRHLQTRALRKLNMLLHRVRIGLGLEEDPLVPNPFATPCIRTPAPGTLPVPATPFPPLPPVTAAAPTGGTIDKVACEMNALADAESVKEELLDEAQIAAAADQVSLFDLSLVNQGVIELDSSSGSDSSSDTSSTSSDGPVVARPDLHAFTEEVPDGVNFYRHRKSSIMHRVKCDGRIAACGAVMSSNFVKLPRVLTVRWPKCLKCFPKDPGRIRSIDQMTDALDAALQRSKKAAH